MVQWINLFWHVIPMLGPSAFQNYIQFNFSGDWQNKTNTRAYNPTMPDRSQLFKDNIFRQFHYILI